jgi:hypothetical protein
VNEHPSNNSGTEVLLQRSVNAATAEEYVQCQSDCIRALAARCELLYAIAVDRSAVLEIRLEALQVLFFLAPSDLDAFLLSLTSSLGDDPTLAEAARALLFRCQIRRTISTDHPDKLRAYLESTQHEYAKWRFSTANRDA